MQIIRISAISNVIANQIYHNSMNASILNISSDLNDNPRESFLKWTHTRGCHFQIFQNELLIDRK